MTTSWFHNPLQVKASVRTALQALPAPRNDYEIVVPEHEAEGEPAPAPALEDQADRDARAALEENQRRET